MAEIYDKSGEQVLILGVREQVVQPFQAPDWTDLRVGFLVSLCDPVSPTGNDTITGLGPETIDGVPTTGPENRYWIGVKTKNDALPSSAATSFIGFSNSKLVGTTRDYGDSVLATSNAGVGAGSDYWRARNDSNPTALGGIFDGHVIRSSSTIGCEQHFVQDYSGGHAAGYATLLMLRLRRDNPNARTITATTKTSASRSGDVLFTSDPSKDLLLTNMESYPATVQTWGPSQLTRIPDALFAYWPFVGSRLRIHCWGIVRVA